jgi:hypothetical protein
MITRKRGFAYCNENNNDEEAIMSNIILLNYGAASRAPSSILFNYANMYIE